MPRRRRYSDRYASPPPTLRWAAGWIVVGLVGAALLWQVGCWLWGGWVLALTP